MEIVLKTSKSKYLEIFSLLDLDNLHETFKRFSSIKEPLEAKIFAVNESISSHQLLKLKNHFEKINICSLCIYSNNRDTIISGKSLKIDSAYIREQEIKNQLLLFNSKEKDKALSLVLGQIERNFGRGSIMRLGDASRMKVETISTGALTLDLALGGGYPKGRVVEVYGPESSGKTTLTLHAIA